jgi:hypothetical protein
MFTLDVTERAEQEILKTLDNYVPQAPSYDKLVGIWLHIDDDEQPKIEYIHPSVASGDKNGISRDDKGIMNIENIYIENETNIAIIELENKNVQISVGKKHPKIVWEEESIMVNNNIKQKSVFKNFLHAALNTNVSNIKFVGAENDEDGNYTTKQNVDDIKNGNYGKYIKINVSGNHSLDDLNQNDKEHVLQEINKFLPTI